jgi:ubiquinone/menaquinone biosynthesis C-methylase UbiE
VIESRRPVDSKLYSEDYFQSRCGGVEFFQKFGFHVLKPAIQMAVTKAALQPSYKILDLGCGRGELVAHLSEKGYDVTGMDYAEDAIKVAKVMYPQGKFVLGDVNFLTYEENSFDRIFFLGTIEHLTDEEINRTLSQIYKSLKPTGRLVVTTCTNAYYHKVLTYRFRLRLSRLLNSIGLKTKLPQPPRSEEDEQLHINETNYSRLKRAFHAFNGPFEIIPLSNPKIYAPRVYDQSLWNELPIRIKNPMKRFFYEKFIFWFPLNLLLARSYVVVATKPSSH